MSIQPVKRTIDEIFSVSQPYDLDFYQRDYKWGKEHVEKLLEDLSYRFELEYKPHLDPDADNISNYDWYYLSTYVTNTYKGKRFIVDGQQRLTSICLILIKLFHLAKSFRLEDRAKLIEQRVRGIGIEGTRFWMGWGGREKALKDLLEHGTAIGDKQPDDLSVSNLYQNYRIIDAKLEVYLNNAHKFESFLLWFLMKVLLVEIDIDDSKDVPMVFEVINDRGERLKPYEVLKGKLLGQLEKSEVETFNKIWDHRIHDIQREDENEVDNFFRFYFRSKFVDTRAEYREFDGEYHRTIYLEKWNSRIGLHRDPERVKYFIREELDYYAELYLRLLKGSKIRTALSEHLFFNSLNDLDRQYLLILSACSLRDPDERSKVKLVASLFDRYFSVLQLTGSYDSNEFTDSIIKLNKVLRDKEIADIEGCFQRQLNRDVSNAKGVQIREPFDWSYFKDASNRNLGIRFVRYLFARMEHFIADNCRMQCEGYYNLVRNTGSVNGYHVEHILADNKQNRALFNNDDELFHQERNRLGALTLLKGRANISSGNEPYLRKLATYAGKANLLWTQSLREDFYHSNPDFKDFMKAFSLGFKPYLDSFDGTAVNERQRLIYDLAHILWP